MSETQYIQDKILQINIHLKTFNIYYDHLVEIRAKHNEKLLLLIINQKCILKHNRRYKNVYKKTAAVKAQIDKLNDEKKDLQNKLQILIEHELSSMII
jgi:hypothetical protein